MSHRNKREAGETAALVDACALLRLLLGSSRSRNEGGVLPAEKWGDASGMRSFDAHSLSIGARDRWGEVSADVFAG